MISKLGHIRILVNQKTIRIKDTSSVICRPPSVLCRLSSGFSVFRFLETGDPPGRGGLAPCGSLAKYFIAAVVRSASGGYSSGNQPLDFLRLKGGKQGRLLLGQGCSARAKRNMPAALASFGFSGFLCRR